jgi:molecular chaperone DnaJ
VVETPVHLTKRQKEILEEFREIQGKEGKKQSPKTASWFDGVKSFVDDLRG